MHALINNQQVEKYPYSIGQLRKDNPQVSFPKYPTDDLLAAYNVFPVAPTEQPAFDRATEKVQEGTPALESGQWVQVWNTTPLTPEEQQQYLQGLQDDIASQTQQRLDSFAKTRNYDGILSLCTYATSANPKFRQEGLYGVEVRDSTWAKLYEILAEVEAGTRPVPSGYAGIESELPELAWPI